MRSTSSLPSLFALTAAISLVGAGCFSKTQEPTGQVVPLIPPSSESMMIDDGANTNTDADMIETTSTATSTVGTMATSTMDGTASSGSKQSAGYAPFTRHDYDLTVAAHVPVLLFFYSADSNESKTQEFVNVSVFKDLALKTQGFRINIGDNQTDGEEVALAKAFGVTKEQTFIFLGPNGKEITRKTGSIPPDELRNLLKEVANR
jgi:hypothetical protein